MRERSMAIGIDIIRDMLDRGELSINPVLDEEEQYQGAKIDLRLDNIFWRIRAEEEKYHDTVEDFEFEDFTRK
jgi:deoxycytidine triphosphate deaminase